MAFLLCWLAAFILTLLRRLNAAGSLALLTIFLLGICAYSLTAHVAEIPDPLAEHHAADHNISARVWGIVSDCQAAAPGERRLTFTLDVDRIERDGAAEPTEGRTIVNWYEPSARVSIGDAVQVSGRLRLLRGFKNPHTFDYERAMYRKGIFTRMYARGPDAVTVDKASRAPWQARWRGFVRERGLEVIERTTWTPETRAFMSAILLGERGLLTDEMKDWFRHTGTFHILAISGLHVGLVYLIISLALTPLPVSARGRASISIAIVWLYALATGGSVPVIRASLMLTLVLAEYYVSREGDFLTALGFAALVITGLDPLAVDEVSFQLSFTAVLLLCTFEPAFERVYLVAQRKLPWVPQAVLHKLALTLFASLVVGVGLAPLVAYHFNIVSFVFPLANLVVVPVLSLALAAGFAMLVVGFAWAKAGLALGLITEAFAWTIFATVRAASAVPSAFQSVGSPPLWVLALEGFGLALVWWRGEARRKATLFLAISLLVIVGAHASDRLKTPVLRATFFDMGDADSCLLEFPGGDTMLVDTGFSTPYLDCGEQLIAPFLRRKRINTLDALVLTHPDADHTGGALFLMEHFEVSQLVVAKMTQRSPEMSHIIEAARRRQIRIVPVSAGDAIHISGALVEVLGPPDAVQPPFSDNESSVVLRCEYGNTRFLFTGDAERRALGLLTASGRDMRSDVLKAPHHGLASSFSMRFVRAVQPRHVIISGRAYRANESMGDRVARYAALCDSILTTRDCGAIIVESDGLNLRTHIGRTPPKPLF
ncbi:MAG: DNA internalization-related competence protein ComEC/Rec2 [Candidatus Abyssubacteria bacterium]